MYEYFIAKSIIFSSRVPLFDPSCTFVATNTEPELLRNPRFGSKALIPPAYVAFWVGTPTVFLLGF